MSACAYHMVNWFYVCHPHNVMWMLSHWTGKLIPWPL